MIACQWYRHSDRRRNCSGSSPDCLGWIAQHELHLVAIDTHGKVRSCCAACQRAGVPLSW